MIAKDIACGIIPPNKSKKEDIVWINAKSDPLKIYGVFYDEEKGMFLRMKANVAALFDDVFQNLNANTSGGRLRFCTDSPYIAISAIQKNNLQINMMNLCGQSGFDLYRDDVYSGTFMPKTNMNQGYYHLLPADGKMHEYTINFPLYDNVCDLYIGLAENANVTAAAPYKNEGRPVVFYGSSITQGASASRPGNAYTSRMCRALKLDYINLGFASKCRGEQAAAEYIAALPMSVFVMDFDHNVSCPEELWEKHLPFYKTVRKGNPALPVVMVSAPDAAISKPGYAERRRAVLASYEAAKAAGDNVYFADGAQLYGADPFDCTVDNVHPNDLGFYRFAEYMIKLFKDNNIAG